jgi:small subunit ribosomal protein S2
MVFIVDVNREETAVHEANLTGIPVVALVDTNCDPAGVDYIIPSNDDAIRAIKLLVAKIADAVIEGKAMRKDDILEGESAAPSEAAAAVSGERPKIDLEDGKEDSDLLGAATLAKMGTPSHEEETMVTEPESGEEEEKK